MASRSYRLKVDPEALFDGLKAMAERDGLAVSGDWRSGSFEGSRMGVTANGTYIVSDDKTVITIEIEVSSWIPGAEGMIWAKLEEGLARYVEA